jgi:hypothetical protein
MDSKKKRNTNPKTTKLPATMTNKQTLHQLIDDMDLQYTTQIQKLENTLLLTKEEHTQILAESRLSALEQSKQYESTIQELRSQLEETKKELQACKSKTNEEIGSFKDVSILNQYLKEIYQLKNDNTILTKRFDSTKKILEQSQTENKHFRALQKELTLVSHCETASQASIEAVEELEEEAEEEPEEEEVEEPKEEEVEEPKEEESVEAVEPKEEEEPTEEIDVSKLDVIEVDDVEYYLDLDNQIRDKDSLEILGKVTDDGDAIFS